MKPVIVKAYGGLSPATKEALAAVQSVLRDWYISEAAELSGDLLRISYEGDFFPHAEVAEAVKPFLCPESEGRLDILDFEAWTLCRYFFSYGHLRCHTATLNKALEACSLHE